MKVIGAPASAQMASAARLTATGRATRGVGLGLDHQAQQHQQGLVVGEHRALVVDDGQVLAVGVDHRPQVGARGPDQVGDPGGVGRTVDRHHPGVWA